jgi:peptide deformylase
MKTDGAWFCTIRFRAFPGFDLAARVRLVSSPSSMIREIVQYGHPVLRQKCRPVTEVTDELVQLVADMLETMVDANGVGLAAPQVGEDLRLAVIDVSHDPECVSLLKVNGEDAELESIMPLIFINPELEFSEEKESGMEGCLSIQGIRAEVKRPAAVRATLPQLDGSVLMLETDGLLARALQHEIDHLNGVLFVDRLSPVAKVSMKNRLKRLLDAGGKA